VMNALMGAVRAVSLDGVALGADSGLSAALTRAVLTG